MTLSDVLYHIPSHDPSPDSQQERALSLLKRQGMARLSEFIKEGITATTVARLLEKGLVHKLSRGLYQLPDAATDANHALAEAAKRVPKGVICLVSALAYHQLTDTIPHSVWMAIGPEGPAAGSVQIRPCKSSASAASFLAKASRSTRSKA